MYLREQEKMLQSSLGQMVAFSPSHSEHPRKPHTNQALKCPRCDSLNTKFCYYNNYSLTQPRHFCKNCKRYWTIGGILRNVPVGGGCRKDKRSKQRNAQHGSVKSSDTLSFPTISGENSSGTHGASYSNSVDSSHTPLPTKRMPSSAISGCLKGSVDEVNHRPSNIVSSTITDNSKASCSSSGESSNLSFLVSSCNNSMLDEFLDSALLGFTIPNTDTFGNLDSDYFNGGCCTLEKMPHHLTAPAGLKSETDSIISSGMQGADLLNCVNFSSLQCMPQQQQEYQGVRGSIAPESRQQQTSSWRMRMEDCSLRGYGTVSDEGFSNWSLDCQLLPEGLFYPADSLCYMNGTL